jgi:hypothetical protein
VNFCPPGFCALFHALIAHFNKSSKKASRMNIERYLNANRNRKPEQVMVTTEDERFLNLRRLPGVLTPERVTVWTGFNLVELGVFDAVGILSPLGNRKKRCKKLYATVEVEAFLQDVGAMDAAMNAIATYWAAKNKSRRNKQS